jgi:hypothetical protein
MRALTISISFPRRSKCQTRTVPHNPLASVNLHVPNRGGRGRGSIGASSQGTCTTRRVPASASKNPPRTSKIDRIACSHTLHMHGGSTTGPSPKLQVSMFGAERFFSHFFTRQEEVDDDDTGKPVDWFSPSLSETTPLISRPLNESSFEFFFRFFAQVKSARATAERPGRCFNDIS